MISHPQLPGVRIAGSAIGVPETVLDNNELERLMDTSNEWIIQRTGIRERHVADLQNGETVIELAKRAGAAAIEDAGIQPSDVDMVIMATMCMESTCPPSACRVAAELGCETPGAFDLSGACCGFVFGLNTAAGVLRTGGARNVLLIGADTLTQFMRYDTRGRGTAILFGDGAGAMVLSADEDPKVGLIAQAMHSDGRQWADLFIPSEKPNSWPDTVTKDERYNDQVIMNGRAVFKFAVSTFTKVIEQTLERAGLQSSDVDQFVCHQSNARILEAARERFGLEPERLHVNIDRYGNTVAASVPLVYQDLVDSGRIERGQRVMFVAFGGGLTWGTSLWQF